MRGVRLIIHSLSEEDKKGVRKSFYRKFDKISRLFQFLSDGLDDEQIKKKLNLSGNAYSTLRSRLQKKIQDYLISKSDGPKINVLKKLMGIDELIFTQKRSIVLTTLKKLEKELIRYDLSNELATVYHYLKNLHINSAEYFHYSQLYNRHVAYSLAMGKAEDILANYFKLYGHWYVMNDDTKSLQLTALFKEMTNVCSLYKSHRMHVYQTALHSFHCMFVDEKLCYELKLPPLENVFNEIEITFSKYKQDSLYQHLTPLFLFIRLEYYAKHSVWVKASILLDEMEPQIPRLLANYKNYTFPAQILITKTKLALRNNSQEGLYYKDREMFDAIPELTDSISSIIVYFVYRALSCYYKSKYQEAYKWLFNLTNKVSFKENLTIALEIKCLMAFIKVMQNDFILFRQNFISAQRQLRQLGKDNAEHLVFFMKLLSIANSTVLTNRLSRINRHIHLLENVDKTGFKPTLLIPWDAQVIASFEDIIIASD